MDASEGDTVSHLVLWTSILPTMINKHGVGKISHSSPKVNWLQVVQVTTLCMALYYTPNVHLPSSRNT